MKDRIRTPEQRRAYQEKKRLEKARQRYEERQRRYQEEREREMSPEMVDAWLNDPRPLCPLCHQPSNTIAIRIDPYLYELNGVEDEMETCLGCWDARRMEI